MAPVWPPQPRAVPKAFDRRVTPEPVLELVRALQRRRSSTSSSLSVSVMADRIIEEPEARFLQVRSPDASLVRVHPYACMDEPFMPYGRARHRVARTHVV